MISGICIAAKAMQPDIRIFAAGPSVRVPWVKERGVWAWARRGGGELPGLSAGVSGTRVRGSVAMAALDGCCVLPRFSCAVTNRRDAEIDTWIPYLVFPF